MVTLNVYTETNGLEIAYETELDDLHCLEVLVSPPGLMNRLDDLTPEQMMQISKLKVPISYDNGKVRISDPFRNKLSERPQLSYIVPAIEESTFTIRGNPNDQ